MALSVADSRVEDALRLQSQMEGSRSNWESYWQDVADFVLPRQSGFSTKRVGGERLDQRIFDSTAPLGLERFAAAMESMLTPRSQEWHDLSAPESLMSNEDVSRYLYQVKRTLFKARYAPKANFASQMHETYMGMGAFGTGALFVDEMIGQGLRYIGVPLAELFLAENYQGSVDVVHRRFERTARQLVQRWPDTVPDAVKKAAEREPGKCFDVLHCFKPREDAAWSRLDYRGMPWASYYVLFEGRTLLGEGGYRTFRYALSRYVTGPKEVYGRSVAMMVLPTIKGANEMQKTLLRTGQKIADPPLLLSDDGALSGFSLAPGSLNPGALDQTGAAMVKPLAVGADMPITMEMQQGERKVINDAFLVTLFQILVDAPDMTATQAMLRAQEKGELLAPTGGRQQSEMLGPLIQAEIDILARAGQFPPMPDELRGHGGDVEIEYDSPLTRAMRASEGVAVMRTLEQVAPIAQVDPSVMKVFRGTDIARFLADVNGMPSQLLNDDKAMQAIQEADAQTAQAAQLLAAAPVAAGAVKDLAGAQSLMASSPNQVAPPLGLPVAA